MRARRRGCCCAGAPINNLLTRINDVLTFSDISRRRTRTQLSTTVIAPMHQDGNRVEAEGCRYEATPGEGARSREGERATHAEQARNFVVGESLGLAVITVAHYVFILDRRKALRSGPSRRLKVVVVADGRYPPILWWDHYDINVMTTSQIED
ncbi:hypothetical protein EVAR_14168_1 [Eumeta japonica]|uniref:Uncharacterized protein n=1 Tax=Eumeta variegata TaxID=151549 RepID=A0A4C1UEG4_EUMVA|nr:hypothetical protein EVAR_14168_1 [Eumeta japonica]